MSTISYIREKYTKYCIDNRLTHLDIELLVAHVLNISREKIICCPDFNLTAAQEDRLHYLLAQRIKGLSIAQIVGKKEFWKHEFIVSPNTLVPRPDSETIITTLLKLYPNKKKSLYFADFGVGSGCLIISALLEYTNSYGLAFEKSKRAYEVAYKNIQKHNLQGRLKLVFGSWEMCKNKMDVIISNPPYIKREDIAALPNTISKYEPRIALDGGNNGLNSYQSIIKVAARCLKKEGNLILEIGNHKQLLQINKIANPLKIWSINRDLTQSPRVVVLKKKTHSYTEICPS